MPDYAVLFVCTGNICRSPTAHGVLAQRLEHAGLATRVQVDSAAPMATTVATHLTSAARPMPLNAATTSPPCARAR